MIRIDMSGASKADVTKIKSFLDRSRKPKYIPGTGKGKKWTPIFFFAEKFPTACEWAF